MQMQICGISVEIIKKQIKNMHLYVLPPDGRVRVTAPVSLPENDIEMFVRAKLNWIKKHQEIFKNRPVQPERQYASGETLYLWGKPFCLQVENGGRKNNLALSGNEAILTVRGESMVAQREKFVNEWYRDILKKKISEILPIWEKITGLYCSGWQTKNMKTRWGTCNTQTRKIWLNLQLAQKPPECLEYVILHELSHLKVKNHGPRFIAVLDKYMPSWRERKKLLNTIQQSG